MSGSLKRPKRSGRGKRLCPICSRTFAARPTMRLHLWAEAIAPEVGLGVAETEAALKELRSAGLLSIDRRGDLTLSSQAGELAEDIREAQKRIEEEEAS